MWEIDELLFLINRKKEKIRILKSISPINKDEISNTMIEIYNLIIRLNQLYENEYQKSVAELGNLEPKTIEELGIKEQKQVELLEEHKQRLGLERLFDRLFPEENELLDWCNFINEKIDEQTLEHQENIVLVQEQLEKVKNNKQKELSLNEEYRNNHLKIKEIREKMMAFEDFNTKLNEEYVKFIETNEIDKIDVEFAFRTQQLALRKIQAVEENMELHRQSNNLDPTLGNLLYRYHNNPRDRNSLEESTELLFMVKLAKKMREEVITYEELEQKAKAIAEMVENREEEIKLRNPHITNFDKISSRTNKFKDDVELIRIQILGEQKIEHLENRNNEVKNELNFLVEDVDVKGLRALLEIFDEKNQTRNIDIPQEQDITFDATKELSTVEEEPDIIFDATKELSTVEEEPDISFDASSELPIMEESDKDISFDASSELPIMEPEILEVKESKKASNKLLEKIRSIKVNLLELSYKAAPFILAGALAITSSIVELKESYADSKNDSSTPIVITDTMEEQVLDEIKEFEELVETQTHSIGDKIYVDKGTKYYRDAISAQFDNNGYEVGVGNYGLRADNYNINRIALMEKDMLGNSTGNVLAVNTTPGVSDKELAESLGLEPADYEVIVHIGSGDENGNYTEASIDSPAEDDLCWIRSDSPFIKVVTPASEVLNNSGKGIAR